MMGSVYNFPLNHDNSSYELLLFIFVLAETLWFCNLLILWYNFHTLGKLPGDFLFVLIEDDQAMCYICLHIVSIQVLFTD